MSKYYRGNYYKDYEKEYHEHKGWLVGEFMECFRKTKSVEIKFWKFNKYGKIEHEKKLQCRAIECTFILKGRIRGEIDNEEVFLGTGDYVVIPPRVSNNFPIEILECAEGLTIKVPSDKTDKITENFFNPAKGRGNNLKLIKMENIKQYLKDETREKIEKTEKEIEESNKELAILEAKLKVEKRLEKLKDGLDENLKEDVKYSVYALEDMLRMEKNRNEELKKDFQTLRVRKKVIDNFEEEDF